MLRIGPNAPPMPPDAGAPPQGGPPVPPDAPPDVPPDAGGKDPTSKLTPADIEDVKAAKQMVQMALEILEAICYGSEDSQSPDDQGPPPPPDAGAPPMPPMPPGGPK
jgi:hypothetical protein